MYADQKRRAASQRLDQRPGVHVGASVVGVRRTPGSAKGPASVAALYRTSLAVFGGADSLRPSGDQFSFIGISAGRNETETPGVDAMGPRYLPLRCRCFVAPCDNRGYRSTPRQTSGISAGWAPDQHILFKPDYRRMLACGDYSSGRLAGLGTGET